MTFLNWALIGTLRLILGRDGFQEPLVVNGVDLARLVEIGHRRIDHLLDAASSLQHDSVRFDGRRLRRDRIVARLRDWARL